jgi:hypothetical protein
MLVISKKFGREMWIMARRCPPRPPAQNVGWDQWPQQEGELVEENELQMVNNLANVVVVNAMAAGIMQHPDVPQDSHSISSETTYFSKLRGSL